MTQSSKIRQITPLLLILFVSITAWSFGLHHYFNFETLQRHQAELERFVDEHLALALIFFMFLYIVMVLLSIPLAAFMSIVGGFLFGQWLGVSAVVIAATIGSVLLFISAKNASLGVIAHKSPASIQKMQRGFQENAFSYLLTLRLIPLFPFSVVNFAAAFFQVPLNAFALGTFFGIMPASFIYSSIGVSMQELIQMPNFAPENLLDARILFALSGLGVLALLPSLYKYLKSR